MQLTSPAFDDGGSIPERYTCDGDNASPPLLFWHVPADAKSLALIMEDPDVPHHVRKDGLWVHWVVWGLSPSTPGIEEGATPPGTVGVNTRGRNAYGGPCPPDGQHRYFFKLFALDTLPTLPITTSKKELLNAMDGHIIVAAELMGVYDRDTHRE